MFISCRDEQVIPNNEFTVIVENTNDPACHLPLIRFLEKENQVKKRTSYESLVYNAYFLDNNLNIVGKKLIIEFKDVDLKDLRVCNTMWIGYPGIAIVSAREE